MCALSLSFSGAKCKKRLSAGFISSHIGSNSQYSLPFSVIEKMIIFLAWLVLEDENEEFAESIDICWFHTF